MSPLYEYECPSCGHGFEMIKPFSESDKDETCPHCGSISRRLISVAHHTFGWRLAERCHEVGQPKEEWEKNV